jgi:hypothetical protein
MCPLGVQGAHSNSTTGSATIYFCPSLYKAAGADAVLVAVNHIHAH